MLNGNSTWKIDRSIYNINYITSIWLSNYYWRLHKIAKLSVNYHRWYSQPWCCKILCIWDKFVILLPTMNADVWYRNMNNDSQGPVITYSTQTLISNWPRSPLAPILEMCVLHTCLIAFHRHTGHALTDTYLSSPFSPNDQGPALPTCIS